MIFDCDFGNWHLADMYTCFPIIHPGDSDRLVGVTGNHFSGRSDEDVLVLYVYGQQVVNRIPQGIGNFFPNLAIMNWDVGSLNSIDAEDLESLPHLKVLSLGGNKIVSLNGKLFQYTSKLQEIYINDNLLQHIGHDLLTILN